MLLIISNSRPLEDKLAGHLDFLCFCLQNALVAQRHRVMATVTVAMVSRVTESACVQDLSLDWSVTSVSMVGLVLIVI